MQVNLHEVSCYEKDGSWELDVSAWAGISEEICNIVTSAINYCIEWKSTGWTKSGSRDPISGMAEVVCACFMSFYAINGC